MTVQVRRAELRDKAAIQTLIQSNDDANGTLLTKRFGEFDLGYLLEHVPFCALAETEDGTAVGFVAVSDTPPTLCLNESVTLGRWDTYLNARFDANLKVHCL